MIYFMSRNVSAAGLEIAYYEMIIYIYFYTYTLYILYVRLYMHIRSMNVHNLHLKPEMMNGDNLIKGCFFTNKAFFKKVRNYIQLRGRFYMDFK